MSTGDSGTGPDGRGGGEGDDPEGHDQSPEGQYRSDEWLAFPHGALPGNRAETGF